MTATLKDGGLFGDPVKGVLCGIHYESPLQCLLPQQVTDDKGQVSFTIFYNPSDVSDSKGDGETCNITVSYPPDDGQHTVLAHASQTAVLY